MIIERIHHRIEDGQERWTVAWRDFRTGRWRRLNEGREVFASRHAIVNLAGRGFPVTTATADALVGYLFDYATVNAKSLPTADSIGRCGWIGEDRFVLGNRSLTADKAQTIEFFAESSGETQFVDALCEGGEADEWMNMASAITERFPRAAVVLYASLAVPLLRVVGVPSFIMHLWDDTSSGKSTTLEVAMSVWGDPRPGQLLRAWEGTLVHAERLAHLAHDLPIALDEAQVAQSELLGRLIYLIAQGTGRGRGARKGLQSATSWRTICLSAGERALHTATKYQGAGARVLTLHGSPFGSRKQQKLVEKIRATTYQHFGHAGPRVLQAVLGDHDRQEKLQADYRGLLARWGAQLDGNVGARRAQCMAVIELAGRLAHDVLQLPGNPTDNLQSAAESLVRQGGDRSYARSAFDVAYNLAVSQQAAFHGREREDHYGEPIVPHRYLGVWKRADRIAFIPEGLEHELHRHGYDLETSLRGWAAQDWVQRDGSNLRVKVSLPGHARPRMIVVGVRDGEPCSVEADDPAVADEDDEASDLTDPHQTGDLGPSGSIPDIGNDAVPF